MPSPNIEWKAAGKIPKGHETTEVHTDAIAPIAFSPVKYETTKFRQFKLNHMLLPNKVVLQFFSQHTIPRVQEVIARYLGLNQLYPPTIEFVGEVRSHAVTFKGAIPEAMLQWINVQVKKIDEELSQRR